MMKWFMLKNLCVALLMVLLTACGGGSKKENVDHAVVVHPLDDNGTEDNTTSGGNDDNTTGGTDDNTTSGGNDTNTTITLKALTLTVQETSLNKDANTTITVEATYSDNTTKDVTDQVEWIVDKQDAVTIQKHTLTAKQDKPVRLLAKVGKKVSNAVTLNIYWEVDGYRLPPKPDKVLNDATLGGVDANSNGVRDDVERKIYEKYPVKLQRALLMDRAIVFQEAMVKPLSEAEKTSKIGTKSLNCHIYLRRKDATIKSDDFRPTQFLENSTVNTKQRVRKYLDYNLALSGGVYGSSPSDWNKDACSKEIQKILEEMGL